MQPEDYITNVAGADCEQCYLAIKAQAMALSPDDRVTINVDIPSVILTGIGVIPKLAPYVEAVKVLPDFDFQEFQAFRERTLALHYIQAKYTHAQKPPEFLVQMLTEATKRRDVLLADAGALIARGIVNKEAIAEYKGLTGYKNVAFDFTGLVELMTETWPQIDGKSLLTRAELDDHRQYALRFVEAVAYRDQNPNKVAELTDIRQRIYTLFSRSYDQVRRAISFLRWDFNDAETIAPSLYANRGGNVRKPLPSDVEGTATTPVSSTTNTLPIEAASGTKLPVGHPDASPFASA